MPASRFFEFFKNGFSVDDLINNFKNYFYSKMVIDATGVVEFANPNTLKKLVNQK